MVARHARSAAISAAARSRKPRGSRALGRGVLSVVMDRSLSGQTDSGRPQAGQGKATNSVSRPFWHFPPVGRPAFRAASQRTRVFEGSNERRDVAATTTQRELKTGRVPDDRAGLAAGL